MAIRSFAILSSSRALLTNPSVSANTPRCFLASVALDKNWNFAAAKADFLQRARALKAMAERTKMATPEAKTATPEAKMATSDSPHQTGYATLVPLCIVNDTPCVLFTLRSSNLLKHRGEISFPGGKADPMDENLIETALRETEEETGLPPSRVQVWTSLPAFPTRNRQGLLTAVVGFCGTIEETDLRANPMEVQQIFVCSLAHLCRAENNGLTSFRSRLTMPLFKTGRELDWRHIWGMTAVTLEFVLQCLVPQIYPHRRLYASPNIVKTKPTRNSLP